MRPARIRWFAALLACIGCGLLVEAPVGAEAAQSNHSAAPAKVAHPNGFFVTEQGQVTKGGNEAALVRDGDGGEHVISTKRRASAPGDKGVLLYITRKAGAAHWTTHAIPGLVPMAGGIQVEEHVSFSGLRVFAVFYQCNGVFVSDAALTASRLPVPTLVKATDDCASPLKPAAAPIADAIGLPGSGDQIGVLLPDPTQANQPALFEGSPGGTFSTESVGALPATDSIVAAKMTIDQWDGRITVIATGTDGTHEAIYALSKPWYVTNWPAPTKIASLGLANSDYTVESLTAYHNVRWVGLLKPHRAGSHPKHALFTVRGTSSGQWLGVLPLPRSTGRDTALQLSINVATNHIHAAWTRVDTASKVKKSGIMEDARIGSRWSKPKFFTHWYRDRTSQITVTTKGHVIIGYVQR